MTKEVTKERVQNALERMVYGKYTGWTIGQVTDKIAWLWQWRKITYEEMTTMTAQARYILGELKAYDPDTNTIGE